MEWKTVKLGEVSSILGDGIHGTPVYDAHGTYYFINGNNLDNGRILLKGDTKKVDRNEYIKHKKDLTDRTILISINGTLGNTAKYNGEPCILGKSACYFNVLPEYDKVFIYYVVTNSKFRTDLEQMATGTTIKNVSLKSLREYKFAVPVEIHDQHRIAAILSSLDDKIENNKRINANLEAQAQALFKSWFIDLEPWGGVMPEDWREGTLGDIIEEQPKSKIQVNAAKDIKGKYPFFTSGTSIYEYNEALISGRNLYLNTGGAAGIEFYVGEAAYSTDTWCIKGIEDFTDFLYLYITSIINIVDTEYFEGSALKHLKKKPFKERKIIIPTNKIKDDFNKKVVPIFDIIMKNYSENKRLAALRDTLLPKLMKGEIAL